MQLRSMEITKVANGWTVDVWYDDGDHEVFIADSRNDLKNLLERQLVDPSKEMKVA